MTAASASPPLHRFEPEAEIKNALCALSLLCEEPGERVVFLRAQALYLSAALDEVKREWFGRLLATCARRLKLPELAPGAARMFERCDACGIERGDHAKASPHGIEDDGGRLVCSGWVTP